MDVRKFVLKLHLCAGIGIKTESRLYQTMVGTKFKGDIADLCCQSGLPVNTAQKVVTSWYSDQLNSLVDQHLQQCEFLTIFDHDYPAQLREIYCPPLILFYRGNKGLLQQRMLGVVGARKNTSYGVQSLSRLLPTLIEQKITIVSGLAAGIDGASHEITLANHGQTIGVIGTGLDVCYPVSNQTLQERMGRDQLVISEYPLGSRPFRSHFPERNRIIAGLCETLLVVEAKEKSGSLITASLALQENRNVCAVPGRIDALMSVGCNQLILAGAKPILRSQDLLEEFKL